MSLDNVTAAAAAYGAEQYNAGAAKVQADFDAYKAAQTPPPTTTPPPIVIPPPTSSGDLATPAGMRPFYVRDWAQDGDDGKWPATTGRAGNNAATFTKDPKNVSYVSGKGQVLTAYDVGGVIYSGRVQANIKAPTFGHWRWICTVSNFAVGAWPSLWARGDDSIGELDVMEGFGGHVGSSMMVFKGTAILTGPSSAYNQGSKGVSYDTAVPKAAWGSEHMYEIIWDKSRIQYIVDQKVVGDVTAAELDAVSKNKTTYTWAKQFANATRTWHLRADAQAGNYGTHKDSGVWPMGQGYTFSQTQRGIGIYLPA